MGARRQSHQPKKDSTRTITFRLPQRIVEELESDATQKNISQNVLVKQILEKYVIWDRFSDKIGMLQVPKSLLRILGKDVSGDQIDLLSELMLSIIKNSVLFMKGGFSLERCIETLEDYMNSSGIKSDHRVEGSIHHFIIQHELGINWSFFVERLLERIFKVFTQETVKFLTTDSTVIASISLGSDFSEHNY